MSDPPASPDRAAGTGGGAATNAGVQFQAQLGALIAASVLSGAPLDSRFGLAGTAAKWLRFETEAPVDDLLIATAQDGFVAIQAKTTVSASANPTSAFAKTVDQFVRHWLACRDGGGSARWNRPLDPAIDRLVLAVGPQTSAAVRVDLPRALQRAAQPGGGAPTQAEAAILETFKTCAEAAWTAATDAEVSDTLVEDLARLVTVFEFRPDGPDGPLVAATLRDVLAPTERAEAAARLLEHICIDLAARRGGADAPALRKALRVAGARLEEPHTYRADVAALKAHSDEVRRSLERFEIIEAEQGQPISLRRDCQAEVEAAARGGSLLLVGEPGTGKSGVLNALARSLKDKEGADVVALAVDRYSVESLEGLSKALGLEHPLVEVLAAWEGEGPAWLILDALDATRGGRGEGVFRALIDGVLRLNGRWNVVASIRTFDLRMGEQFRSLFKGEPPAPDLAEPGFAKVRHVRIPAWSPGELDQLKNQSPQLAAVLENADPKLRELAVVPFNTRLLSDLLADGVVEATLASISSQAELLSCYWDRRIRGHGVAAETCLRRIVDGMVASRSLRFPRLDAADKDPKAYDDLVRDGVLIEVESERWTQFRHHLLFDYAASRLIFEPSRLVSGEVRFAKDEALGLMLAPALAFVLREIWATETDHARFWIAVTRILADEGCDPVIRSAAGRLAAEFPQAPQDATWLAERVIAGDADTIDALGHLVGALAVRLEDHPETPLEPWAVLAAELGAAPDAVAGPLRLLLYLLLARPLDPSLVGGLGATARALLAYGLGLGDPGYLVSTSIDFVIQTYATDAAASRALLETLFDPQRFAAYGFDEIPTLARKIAALGDLDPDFAAKIYREVYTRDIAESRQTRLGNSQILSLTSTSKQDYDMARYSLGEYLSAFLKDHPEQAAPAVARAISGYVAREHAPREGEGRHEHRNQVENQQVTWTDDLSYIWAHDPNEAYGEDGDALLVKLVAHLRAAEPAAALRLTELLIPEAREAVIWARLFLAGAERGGAMADLLWPWAVQEAFVVSRDTRKDAIDVIGEGWPRRTPEERAAFEAAALDFDFSDFHYSAEARASVLRTVFRRIGADNLVSDAARAFLVEEPEEPGEAANNERLFRLTSGGFKTEPYYWIQDLDRTEPANQRLIDAIEALKAMMGLETEAPKDLSLADALAAMTGLADLVAAAPVANETLKQAAHGYIGQGVRQILKAKLLPPAEDDPNDVASALFDLIELAAASPNPEVRPDTEAQFEGSASWGSPAPRVDAGEAIPDLCLARPALYPRAKPWIDKLLVDPHPAVRLQAVLRLVRLWDINRDEFWARLKARADKETNLEILRFMIDGVVRAVINSDVDQTEDVVARLLARYPDAPERTTKLRNHVADTLAILWVTHARPTAKALLDSWMADPPGHETELIRVLFTLRTALVLGLPRGTEREREIRGRAVAFFGDLVVAANTVLKPYFDGLAAGEAPAEGAQASATKAAHLVDTACRELYFAMGAPTLPSTGRKILEPSKYGPFLAENQATFRAICCYATPSTVYYLSQTLEVLTPCDPALTFDLLASAILSGGQKTGYQNESLGSDLLVKMIGVFLADHKDIFEAPERRAALIECLELFMKAGWPAARRLLYRLPELIQ